MNISSHNRRQSAAVALCGMILAVLLISMSYIVVESHHDCIGEGCPVCEMLELCQHTIQKIGAVVFISVVFIFASALESYKVIIYFFVFENSTLVRQKVRMNN